MWVFTLGAELSLVLKNTVNVEIRFWLWSLLLLCWGMWNEWEVKLQNCDFQCLWLYHILSEKEGAA